MAGMLSEKHATVNRNVAFYTAFPYCSSTWPKIKRPANQAVFSLDGVTGSQREYIRWLIGVCAGEKTTVEDVLAPEALDLLASRLRTPLQIEQHLILALETGYQASMKPISNVIIEDVLSKRLDDLGPTLIRHGYTVKVLCELLGARSAEVRALLRQMLAAGLPV